MEEVGNKVKTVCTVLLSEMHEHNFVKRKRFESEGEAQGTTPTLKMDQWQKLLAYFGPAYSYLFIIQLFNLLLDI